MRPIAGALHSPKSPPRKRGPPCGKLAARISSPEREWRTENGLTPSPFSSCRRRGQECFGSSPDCPRPGSSPRPEKTGTNRSSRRPAKPRAGPRNRHRGWLGADVEGQPFDETMLPEEKGHKHAPQAAVAVMKRMQGFGVQDGQLHQPVRRVPDTFPSRSCRRQDRRRRRVRISRLRPCIPEDRWERVGNRRAPFPVRALRTATRASRTRRWESGGQQSLRFPHRRPVGPPECRHGAATFPASNPRTSSVVVWVPTGGKHRSRVGRKQNSRVGGEHAVVTRYCRSRRTDRSAGQSRRSSGGKRPAW